MDEIVRLQQSYAVPDAELRSTLQKASQQYIGPKYREFFDKYAHVPFTKNPEKYVKYNPDDVEARIQNFFDVS